jgi:KRAB domain-containing zinc finger protein
MSEIKQIKIEPLTDDNDQIESVGCIENNIKKEKEVQFLLILPPRQVKVEKEEDEETVQTQSIEKKFKCQQCPKSFEKRDNLSQHEKTHNPKVNCGNINKKASKSSIKHHMKRHENIKKFNCDHCSVGFARKGALVSHMWKHRSDKQFNCTECNRGFNNIYDFKIHLLSHSTNPRPFQCDLCPKSYPTKRWIKDHLMAMHSELIFKCDKCDFTTKWKESLSSHKRRHSNAKPFSCSMCEKKFKTKAHVKNHQAVHRTAKNFECKTCGKFLKSQNSLRQHERTVHGKNFKSFPSNLI